MNSIEKQNELRKHHEQATAISKLEGWTPSQADLDRQERHIRGEATIDELVNEIISEALCKQEELKARNTKQPQK